MMKKICLLLAVLATVQTVGAQDVAIKTNLVDDALLDVNLGVEVGLAPRWTVDVPFSYNGWILSHGRRWKHWYAQPGVRYWFCDRFAGHFVGVHTHGGQYNMGGFNGRLNLPDNDFRKLEDSRYQGWFVGAGISYGYAWILGTHWNLEAEIGVGYSYTQYDQFRCTGCGKRTKENEPHHYVGPTKASVNLVYLF